MEEYLAKALLKFHDVLHCDESLVGHPNSSPRDGNQSGFMLQKLRKRVGAKHKRQRHRGVKDIGDPKRVRRNTIAAALKIPSKVPNTAVLSNPMNAVAVA